MNRGKLIEFVKQQHGDQVRKYTGEPYFNHLLAVAEMADCKCDYGFEIGLCHDLLEDTSCTDLELYTFLQNNGYNIEASEVILKAVVELTDIYTAENSPELNRKHRKHLEALRLHQIGYEAQTVKYCDLIDNGDSIALHDPSFAKVYLKEKSEILEGMNAGDYELYLKAKLTLHHNLATL
jgi:(p)ppGpp synthase/HD superfamily hydrolase